MASVPCCVINKDTGCSAPLFSCQHQAVHPLDQRTHTHTQVRKFPSTPTSSILIVYSLEDKEI